MPEDDRPQQEPEAPSPAPPSREEAASPAPPPAAAPAEDGDFGRMLDGSLQARSFADGQTVEGTVVAIQRDVAFLDIGGKSEATIDLEELKDSEGNVEVQAGERVQAVVVSTEGGLKLSRRLARGAVAREQIVEAFQSGLPVEGKVARAIKGGFEVRVAGQRAFCPMSQIDVQRTADAAAHVGRVYTFRITECKGGGKDLVISRRALLLEAERAKAEEVRASIEPGATLKGRVVSVRDYGAFVDLGAGVQGLLHVSEMSWARVTNPAEVVKPGDEITVKILRIDEGGKKIALGLKQLQQDPWETVAQRYAAGQTHQGKVSRLADFGAFVELEPGIEALAHVSAFPPAGGPGGWRASVVPGTVASFEILSVDPAKKRIGVAMLTAGGDRLASSPAPAPAAPAPKSTIVAGSRMKGKVERHESFGVFVYLAPGRTGLLPVGESATPRGTDLKKAFPVGSEVEVAVLEVDPSGRKIRLSRKALLDAEERSAAREYEERQARQTSESLGPLAEKLREALKKRS